MTLQLQRTLKSFIRPGDQSDYVAECLEIAVVTQGETLDEVVSNLQDAIALHLEDEDAAEFGLVAHPSVLATFELQPSYAKV